MSKQKRAQTVTAVVVHDPSPGHIRFADAYVRLGSVKAACEEAEYSAASGNTLMEHPDVKREIARLREQLQKACDFNLEAAFKQGQRLLERFELQGDSMACVRAFELVTKMAGHLAEKQIEKPRVNVRQALLDAGEAAAKREAWDAFLIEWNKRNQAQDVPESEMFQ